MAFARTKWESYIDEIVATYAKMLHPDLDAETREKELAEFRERTEIDIRENNPVLYGRLIK